MKLDRKLLGFLALAWVLGRSQKRDSPRGADGPELVPSPRDVDALGEVWPYTLPERVRRSSLDALHEDAHPHFLALFEQARALGLTPRIADATRSPREQREERASRSSKADCSWHLGGRAVDVELKGLGLAWDPDYETLGEYWEARGGQWGGRFRGYGEHGDFRHFEYAPGLGNPKDVGLCDTSYRGVAAYWKRSKRNAAA